jgi:hypothetical protein
VGDADVTPQRLTDQCISQFFTDVFDRVDQDMFVYGVLWRVLNEDTGDNDYPGKVIEYVDAGRDFIAKLKIRGIDFKVYITTIPRLDA